MSRMFRRIFFTALVLLIASTASTAVLAQTPEPAAPAASAPVSKGEQLAALQFKLLDANHDGKLSRDEVAMFSRLADAFDATDSNHDGFVDFEEIRVFAKAYRAQRDAAKKAASAPQ